jgi:hypothetical protein
MFLLLTVSNSEVWQWGGGGVSDCVKFTPCFVQIDHVIQNLKQEKDTQIDSMVISRAYFLPLHKRKTG